MDLTELNRAISCIQACYGIDDPSVVPELVMFIRDLSNQAPVGPCKCETPCAYCQSAKLMSRVNRQDYHFSFLP